MERRADIRLVRLLLTATLLLFLASFALLGVALAAGERRHALSVEEVRSLPAVTDSYRSINNWETVETTVFAGTPVTTLLERCKVTNGGATVRLLAPDGYFWPAVGTTLTVEDLGRANPDGLLPLIAWRMNGEELDPEPDGTGPLRYVSPQYSSDEVNKPSWVSNVRIIEVGPLPDGYRVPEAKDVPVSEVWVCGAVPTAYPLSLILPFVLLGAGFLAAIGSLVVWRRGREKAGESAAGKAGSEAVALGLAAALVLSLAGFAAPGRCLSQPAGVYSASELRSMPASGGRYTFLKQLAPYTYYEEDYTGVALSYLVGQKHSLAPGASGVVVRARDGYAVTLSLEQVNATYAGGLKAIIAYSKGGGQPLKGDEGPLRLIVPQRSPGTRDQGGDANTPLCARMVCAVEVTPVPPGVSPPTAASVPAGSLAVYGSVTSPAPPPQPQPGPAPGPAPEPPGASSRPPAQQAQTAPTGAVPGERAIEDVVNNSFGGGRGLAAWIAGASFAFVLPAPLGSLLWSLFHEVGSP